MDDFNFTFNFAFIYSYALIKIIKTITLNFSTIKKVTDPLFKNFDKPLT